jgi:hypothetical protein
LNDLQVDDAAALNIDHVENVRPSVSSMVSAGLDPDHTWLLHLLAIFRGDLSGECDDSRDDQDLSGVNYAGENGISPISNSR